MDGTPYDIVIIGGGISGSLTFWRLAELLTGWGAPQRKLRIGMIEKEGEFGTGIPYGRRSIVGALAFQKLQDFLDEPERDKFIQWLSSNKEDWLSHLREAGGEGAERWIADNQTLMDQSRWEELYLPRFLFGTYVSSAVYRAIDEITSRGLAAVNLMHGDAIEVIRHASGFHTITIEDSSGGRLFLNTENVVLAIGSPPQKCVHQAATFTQPQHTHIDNLYLPSEESNILRIHEALSSLRSKQDANVLVVGSNASSLEVLYLLNYRPEIKRLINSIVVLSRSGMLPYKICEEPVEFQFSALEALKESGTFSADDLFAAISADIRRAEALKLGIADLRNAVGTLYSQLVAMMSLPEQERFVCKHGVEFSRLMRRAGRDTRNAADDMVDLGMVTLVEGNFQGLTPDLSHDGLVSAIYATKQSDERITYPVPFSITINCGGFEELDFCSSQLINCLIANDLCKVNSTKRGFFVNDRLEAGRNFYVIGPLLAGNFNNNVRFWHVESAARIAGLAKLLAEDLFHSLFAPKESRAPGRTFSADLNHLAASTSPF